MKLIKIKDIYTKSIKNKIFFMLFCFSCSCTQKTNEIVWMTDFTPELLTILPEGCNAPNGATLDNNSNIIMTMPNSNNNYLNKIGELSTPAPKKVIKIDTENNINDWYVFRDNDKYVKTGGINPKDCDFGPDGHLYITDGHGRLLRINVKNGEAIDMDALVVGFNLANGLVWNDSVLFVSESILERKKASNEKDDKSYVISGVYSFTFKELQSGSIKLSPFSENSRDKHLIETFMSSHEIGVGADGVAIDAEGNLYTAIFEDGVLYKTVFNDANVIIETKLFTAPNSMKSADGIIYDPSSNKIFVTDLIDNAIHSVDMKGNVSTLHKNGDTDGSEGLLEAPVDVVIRDGELIILNWDGSFGINKTPDKPFTVSKINLYENDVVEN